MDSLVISPHVLVIGGGAQGLWLLEDLRAAGYEAVLLERRDLGGEQTCHSHVYLHRGHMYNEGERALADRLGQVTALWERWLAAHHPVPYEARASWFGFQNRWDAEEKEDLWWRLGLEATWLDPLPAALGGGAIRFALATPEVCLNGSWLVSALSHLHRDRISRVGGIKAFQVDERRGEVARVEVRMHSGETMQIRPGAVVLAAGPGNQELLELAAGGERSLRVGVARRQQIRKAHMLVVEGPPDVLPRLEAALVLPRLRGLFIVPRRREGRNVWLISDNRSPEASTTDEWLAHDAGGWIPEVMAALARLSPRTLASPDRLRWGIYAGPKAEGRASGRIPHEERVETFRGIANLWAVWPTKLTLAPVASRQILRELEPLDLRKRFRHQVEPAWGRAAVPVTAAQERWCQTPVLPWPEFCRCYHSP